MHVHIASGDGEAKFWIELAIELARNHRYSSNQLNEIMSLVEAHHDELVNAWQQHFVG